MRIITIMMILFTIIACSDNGVDTVVDSALVDHFTAFEAEAAKRGIDIQSQLSEISGKLEIIDETDPVIGQCQHYADHPSIVIIDKNYWDTADEFQREMLVFHELGHCVLSRDHLNSKTNNGNCVSIMNTGSNACNNNYNTATRSSYLDELFSQ